MSNQLTVFQKPSDLMAYLQSAKPAVEMALPKHLNADRMLRIAVTCFSTTPALRECSGQSILASIVVASQLGLEPGIAGQGYLIPYKGTCTFVPGWQGLVGMLNNTGKATAWTGCVYEGDQWEFELGSRPHCIHRPGPNYGDPEKMVWVYACGKVNGSEQPVVEAWPIARVWKHRDRFNKVGAKHYSYQHPEMYARKVVLLQVLKYMPRSVELQNALTATDAVERGNTARVDEGLIVEVQSETVDETPAGKVGQTAIEQASQTSQAKQDTARPVKPKAKPEPEPEPEADEDTHVPSEAVTEAPAKPAVAGPSLASLQTEITKKLAPLGIGKIRFVKFLHEQKLTDSVLAFGDVPADVLQAVVDAWDDYKEQMLPQ